VGFESMKIINSIVILIVLSSFSHATQSTQSKKILSLFGTDSEKTQESTTETPKKKPTPKLIKLFDSEPKEALPTYQSTTLDKYYSKKQKTHSTSNPFHIKSSTEDIESEEELDKINSQVTTTTMANIFDDIKDDEIESFPSDANYYDKITKMVKKAFSLVGSAYKFGASAGGNTYDCSLFTQVTFKKIGLNLPRSSIEQATIGTRISRKDLVAGDLLFFKTYRSSPSHVGIYIGDNKMIHASVHKGVTIDDIDDNYYKKRYLFAKRPDFELSKK